MSLKLPQIPVKAARGKDLPAAKSRKIHLKFSIYIQVEEYKRKSPISGSPCFFLAIDCVLSAGLLDTLLDPEADRFPQTGHRKSPMYGRIIMLVFRKSPLCVRAYPLPAMYTKAIMAVTSSRTE